MLYIYIYIDSKSRIKINKYMKGEICRREKKVKWNDQFQFEPNQVVLRH